MKKVCYINEFWDNPNFKRLQIFWHNISYEVKDKFYNKEEITKWDKNINIFYNKKGNIEPYLYGWISTWVISKDLIKAFEKEIWKEKLYKEVEFLPIKIVPEWIEWPVYNDFYMVHVLNELASTKWYYSEWWKEKLYKAELVEKYDFFKWKWSTSITFSENIAKVIDSFNMKSLEKCIINDTVTKEDAESRNLIKYEFWKRYINPIKTEYIEKWLDIDLLFKSMSTSDFMYWKLEYSNLEKIIVYLREKKDKIIIDLLKEEFENKFNYLDLNDKNDNNKYKDFWNLYIERLVFMINGLEKYIIKVWEKNYIDFEKHWMIYKEKTFEENTKKWEKIKLEMEKEE